MNYLYFACGILTGIMLTFIFLVIRNHNRHKMGGIIEVDNRNNLCKFIVTSSDISNLKTQKVIFDVKHGVDLSRQEQIL